MPDSKPKYLKCVSWAVEKIAQNHIEKIRSMNFIFMI